MRLKTLRYNENVMKEGLNPWELENLSLSKHNLIVGRNATGKTRIINVVHNLARIIQSPQPFFNGEWTAHFSDELNHELVYSIKLDDGKITSEYISFDGNDKFKRTLSASTIYSEVSRDWQDISPPNDRSIIHVRRDKNEFPFLESLVLWASNVYGFAFANTSPNQIDIPSSTFRLTSLNTVPSALEKLTPTQLSKVLKQLEKMGYILEYASTGLVQGFTPNFKMVLLKEQGITYPLKQFEISQGFFRAFALLTIIEYLRSSGDVGAILVDDFGEGLDFDRSKKLAEIIFKEMSDSKIQFIATSNDSFLMNAISLNELTICYRDAHCVKCLNYSTSKQKFEEWKELGLNNFDLFSSNFLLNT